MKKVSRASSFLSSAEIRGFRVKGAGMGASQPKDEGRDGSPGCQELRGWMLEALLGHLRWRALVGWGGKVGFLFRKRAGNRGKPF